MSKLTAGAPVVSSAVITLNEALREYKSGRCGLNGMKSSILRGDLVNVGSECEDEEVRSSVRAWAC
eukprot:scaffold985_cov573-Prasinococcus_capsulatus_cf.AAC.4